MKHLTEEQIVLHCYGDATDGQAIDRHLQACAECRAQFEDVKALLAEIPLTPVPEPPEYLEQKLWLNVRDRLSAEKSYRQFFSPSRWAMAGLMAVLVIAAFVAGRFWPHAPDTQKPPEMAQVNVNPQRVVLVAVGDHLERSQMLLIEIMNADPKDRTDLSSEQEQARSLLDSNRLYRVSAQKTGDPAIVPVLDELERVLAEIANSPSDSSPKDLQEIRSRIQSQDLLFKIHVVHSNVTSEGDALGKAPVNQRL
ncbi:MAG TPA: hypothetical protein VKY85_18585 [Candidatus Angelobacter sp.]|nr:hypothetical protein [Candidatus Angelobacter sp.]